jgi:protein TonB
VDAGHMIFRKNDLKAIKARILKKPVPESTDQARRAGESGTVVLKAVLAADGTVKDIRPFKSLGHGLTEQAIKAAKRIKFEPATMCGKPVPQFVEVQYSFDIF